jgi:glutamate-1-semialdehyde 2,1-aminomutase
VTQAKALERSSALNERAARVIPGGVSSSMRGIEPRAFVRAEGAYIWDADGNRYVDFHGAFGPIILGHADPRLADRVHSGTSSMDIVGAGVSELEVMLAEKLNRLIPSAEKVLFANSGSEATYHAIRVSRAFTGRRKVIKFQGCYHGWHDYTAANVISPAQRMGSMDPISAGIGQQSLDELIVLRFNDVEQLQRTFERHGSEIACVILEPIIHTIGCVLPTERFIAALRQTTKESGAMLIFDEVVTGFRHHLGGYQAICGVTPDLTTLGKAIANGYPVAALAGRADVMDRFNTRLEGDVHFGGTFNGNAFSMVACLATIEALEADDGAIHKRLYALGERMRVGLDAIVERLGITARPTSFGSVFVCYFTDREVLSFDDALTSDPEMYVGFHREMTNRGFYMLPLNLKRNHLTAAHTMEDVDNALAAADEVLTGLAARSGRRPG